MRMQCDRCKETFEGLRVAVGDQGYCTAGFFDVTGTAWGEYARRGEKVVCDGCMQKDVRWIARYKCVAS